MERVLLCGAMHAPHLTCVTEPSSAPPPAVRRVISWAWSDHTSASTTNAASMATDHARRGELPIALKRTSGFAALLHSVQSAVAHTSGACDVAYVLALGAANVSICDVISQKVRTIHGGPIPCAVLPAGPPRTSPANSSSTPRPCSAAVGAPALLRAGSVYVVDPRSRLSTASLATIWRLIRDTVARDAVGKSRTARARARVAYFSAMGAWHRFLLDVIVLPLGVKQALYLDADALVQRSLAELWAAADAHPYAPAVVAARATADTWWRKEYRGVAAASLGRWGLQPRHTFNNGVMLLNLTCWCERRVIERMAAVAAHHAHTERLWAADATGNQVVTNLALAKDVYRVGSHFNARVRSEQTTAAICHGLSCFEHVRHQP